MPKTSYSSFALLIRMAPLTPLDYLLLKPDRFLPFRCSARPNGELQKRRIRRLTEGNANTLLHYKAQTEAGNHITTGH
jgi:hypothetical protein